MDDQIFDQNLKQELPDVSTESRGRRFMNFVKDNKIVVGASAVMTLVIIVIAIFVFGGRGVGNMVSNNVVFIIKGPEQVTSGNETEYQIVYRNGENADLVDLSLEVFFPSNFEFKSAAPASVSSTGQRFDLPNLKSGDDGLVTIRGKVSGATGEEKEIRARLEYRLSNFNSRFTVTTSANTIILAPNLTMGISGPIDVTNGQDATFTINYANVSNEEFENLAIILNPPSGFNFIESNPAPSKDKQQKYWTIPKLLPEERGEIVIKGSFTGSSNQEKLMIAELGLEIGDNFAPLINSSAIFQIVQSSLFLGQTISPEDFVNLGDNISLNLEYKNQGKVGMTDIIITLNLEGTVLDLSRLRVNNAIVTGNTITWKSATLSNLNILAPNQEGEITLNIPLKSDFSTNLENQVIRTTATISSDQVPLSIRANDIEIKLASEVGVSVSGQYVSGSLPMKVGETTVFSLTFLLTNQSNDLENVELIASLPLPSSSWRNAILPASEQDRLSYDPNSSKIRWQLDNLPAFSGKFTPAPVVTFEIEVTPTEVDKGNQIKFFSNIQATGKDTFTDLTIESNEIKEVTTSSLGDDRVNSAGVTVE